MQSTLTGTTQRLWRSPLIMLGLIASIGTARADLVPPHNAAARSLGNALGLPLVVVRPLRDGGGLVDTGAEEEGREALNVRMARSLQKILEEGARGRFVVAWNEAKPAPAQTMWTLEGELSHVATGVVGEEESGPYLGAIRLFREAGDTSQNGPRRLVGAWAGRSESLRFLSVNLRHDPRVDAQGLAGEWGRRVIDTIAGFGSEDFLPSFARWLEALPRAKDVVISLERVGEKRSDEAGPTSSPNALWAGTDFRLSVTPRERSEIYLFEIDPNGRARLVPYRRENSVVRAFGVEQAAGTAIVPLSPIAAGATVGDRRFVVLLRRTHSRSSNTLALQPEVLAASDGARSSQALRNAPVEILGDVVQRDTQIEAARRIYETAGIDAAGTWTAHSLTIRVVERPH